MLIPVKHDEVITEAIHARPDCPSQTFVASHSFITESGTKLTMDRRYSYYGNIIFAGDWNRAGFMSV